MGRGGTGVAAGAGWTPPADQLHVYEGMFQVASASSAVSGTVSGRAAVQFFSRSGLPKDSLKTVSCFLGTLSYVFMALNSRISLRCLSFCLIPVDMTSGAFHSGYMFWNCSEGGAWNCSGTIYLVLF